MNAVHTRIHTHTHTYTRTYTNTQHDSRARTITQRYARASRSALTAGVDSCRQLRLHLCLLTQLQIAYYTSNGRQIATIPASYQSSTVNLSSYSTTEKAHTPHHKPSPCCCLPFLTILMILHSIIPSAKNSLEAQRTATHP